ncbi:SDR family oxidoreductase [Solimonas soli]|uniref:SDR family oxidoreductase n=1 Tax=Solimonas soli TaxID=413479 RepID=UPI00048045A8|nr:SDR family oxidoreductase [Solimonas soli]
MTRNVFITGGNNGIGYEMALALAARGDRVIIASRDLARSQAAVARIKATQANAQIEALALDLGDFADIDRCAADVLARMPTLDVLILNAGLYTLKLRTLQSGFEAMFGIMHLGHFRLTQKLLDAVKAAAQGRVVVTSSAIHALGKIDEASFRDPSRHWIGLSAYGQAKLANLLFTRELARRLAGSGVTVNAFHPGTVATGIYDELPAPVRKLIVAAMLTPAQGADTAIWLATAPELKNVSGEYFVRRRVRPGSAASRSVELAQRLWLYSEELAGF